MKTAAYALEVPPLGNNSKESFVVPGGASQSALGVAEIGFESTSIGQLIVDAKFRLIGVNDVVLDWLGCSRKDLIDLPAIEGLLNPKSAIDFLARIRKFCEAGASGSIEIELVDQRGGVHPAVLGACGHDFPADCGQQGWSLSLVRISSREHLKEKTGSFDDGFLHAFARQRHLELGYIDTDLVYRYVNDAHAERLGKSPAELVGQEMSAFVKRAPFQEILPYVARALSGQMQTFEVERSTKNGERKFYEMRYIPDIQGSVVQGLFFEVCDVSELRGKEVIDKELKLMELGQESEAQLRILRDALFSSEQRHQMLLGSLQDQCVAYLDVLGLVNNWSDGAQRLFGTGSTDMRGTAFWSVLEDLSSNGERLGVDQVLEVATSQGHWEVEAWHLRADGSRFWGHTVLTALRNQSGVPQGFSAITRDLSAAKKFESVMSELYGEFESRIAKGNELLKTAHSNLDEFSHIVAHDLRAPLRHISSFVSLLEEQLGESNDRLTKQYLNSTAKASRRLGHMIEGLLEYARLGRVRLEAQAVPLVPLLDRLVADLKMQNAHRTIEWVIDQNLPVLRGDAALLALAWGNVLSNAVKYTSTREAARIEVGWQTDPKGEKIFFVRDNGVGFDLEKAHSLFVMFQRQHHSMDFEGTGTGLAMTQRVVERHGGRIWAETAPDMGCVFYLTLPCDDADIEQELLALSIAELVS